MPPSDKTLCCPLCHQPLHSGHCARCDYYPKIDEIFIVRECDECGVELEKYANGYRCPSCDKFFKD